MADYAASLTSVRLRINVTPEVTVGVNSNLKVQSHHLNIRAENMVAFEANTDTIASVVSLVTGLTNPDETVSETYTGKVIEITAGAGIGEAKLITAHDGAGKTVTVDSAWVATLDGTSEYQILDVANLFVYQKEAEDPQNPGQFLAMLSNVCTPADYNALPIEIEPFNAGTADLFRHYEVRHYGRSWEELDALATDIKKDVSQLIDAFATSTANNTETTVTYTAP